MRALVIHESLTGNTRAVAHLIVDQLTARGWEASECSSRRVDLGALQQADLLVVGTWVDGLLLVGQRPGGRTHLAQLPLLHGKPTYAYVTYAIHPGHTLDKLTALLEERGADVQGAMTIRRDHAEAGAIDFVDRLVSVSS